MTTSPKESKTKHTPGPWEANFCPEGIFSVLKSTPSKKYPDHPNIKDVKYLCRIRPFANLTDEDKANANLIASAPSLLEALKELILWVDPIKFPDAIIKAENAIQKAEQ